MAEPVTLEAIRAAMDKLRDVEAVEARRRDYSRYRFGKPALILFAHPEETEQLAGLVRRDGLHLEVSAHRFCQRGEVIVVDQSAVVGPGELRPHAFVLL